MNEILKMLFKEILLKSSNIEKIETVEDLCTVTLNDRKIVRIFAANNDAKYGFTTAQILSIANEAYQEVCAQCLM